MIFEVYLDDTLLFYPNDEAYEISNGVVNMALNEAGSFEADVPMSNPQYDNLENLIRSGMIRILQNGNEIFLGELREVTQNFDCTKHVYAVGELAFLFDSIQPQARYQTSPYEMFKALIEKHNSQVEERKRFEVGYVSIADSNNYLYRYTNREDTLTALREKLCDSYDGYLRIRKISGKRFIDLVPLASYGNGCNQEIQFGENLLDYSSNMTATDIATAVIPLGATLNDEDRTPDAIEGLDEYVTIKSVNNGVDYLYEQSAVNKFGWVKVVKQWEDVTKPENLKKKGEEWLKDAQFEKLEINIKAIDGNMLDVNVDAFELGDLVHVWALPYGMDRSFPVRAKDIYLNDISQNTICLGTTYTKSYTSQASQIVNSLEELIPQESEILRNAKNNALAMLNGSVGGHVIFKFDKTNKYIEEIMICNESTEKLSTQKWVWNLNGLGYMYRNEPSDDPLTWNNLGIAMTMQGQLIANFITAGKLTLAGNGSDATLEIYGPNPQTKKEELIGKWDSEGIYAKRGKFSGELEAATGTFAGSLTASELIGNLFKSKDGTSILNFTGDSGDVLKVGNIKIQNSATANRIIAPRCEIATIYGGSANNTVIDAYGNVRIGTKSNNAHLYINDTLVI